jgi:hypothetical protein
MVNLEGCMHSDCGLALGCNDPQATFATCTVCASTMPSECHSSYAQSGQCCAYSLMIVRLNVQKPAAEEGADMAPADHLSRWSALQHRNMCQTCTVQAAHQSVSTEQPALPTEQHMQCDSHTCCTQCTALAAGLTWTQR